jgi:hypothetical protein
MEERTGVLVLDEILNQFGVAFGERFGVFTERHPCSIDYCEIIPERLEQLNLAVLKHY